MSKPIDTTYGYGIPDRPGSKRCPHCSRTYSSVKIKNGKTCCPHCGKEVKPS